MYVEMGGAFNINGVKAFQRNIYVKSTIKEVEKIRKKFNNIDVYSTLYQYQDDKEQNESDLSGPLYLDMDAPLNNEEDFKKLLSDLKMVLTHLENDYGIKKNEVRIYFSGSKGFHIIIPSIVFSIPPTKLLNQYYKAIAQELNEFTLFKFIDTTIYDNKRLIRLINSINGKTGLYKVPVPYTMLDDLTFETIKEYASSPKREFYKPASFHEKASNKLISLLAKINRENKEKIKRRKKVDFNNLKFPPCICNIFVDGATKGFRNNTAIILSSAIYQQGIDYEEGLAIVLNWNAEKNDPPLSDREIENTCKSAFSFTESGRAYGCTSIKNLGLCNEQQCSISKNRSE